MKKMILLLGLILGICNMGVTAFAEEGQVEVQINTRDEKGFAYGRDRGHHVGCLRPDRMAQQTSK